MKFLLVMPTHPSWERSSPEEAVAWARQGRFIEGVDEIRPILDMAA